VATCGAPHHHLSAFTLGGPVQGPWELSCDLILSAVCRRESSGGPYDYMGRKLSDEDYKARRKVVNSDAIILLLSFSFD
jgi:hypothetical protein